MSVSDTRNSKPNGDSSSLDLRLLTNGYMSLGYGEDLMSQSIYDWDLSGDGEAESQTIKTVTPTVTSERDAVNEVCHGDDSSTANVSGKGGPNGPPDLAGPLKEMNSKSEDRGLNKSKDNKDQSHYLNWKLREGERLREGVELPPESKAVPRKNVTAPASESTDRWMERMSRHPLSESGLIDDSEWHEYRGHFTDCIRALEFLDPVLVVSNDETIRRSLYFTRMSRKIYFMGVKEYLKRNPAHRGTYSDGPWEVLGPPEEKITSGVCGPGVIMMVFIDKKSLKTFVYGSY